MAKNKPPVVDPNLPIILRGKIRDVLSALPPGRRATRTMIEDAIRGTFGYCDATADQISEAMEWNHSRNFIDYKFNHDADRDEWFLTPKGASRA